MKLDVTKIIHWFGFWTKLRISKRLIYAFLIVITCTLLLTIVNFLNIAAISTTNQEILRTNKFRNGLMDFIYTMKLTENQVKDLTLVVKTDTDLEGNAKVFLITSTYGEGRFRGASATLEPLLKEMAPKELLRFQELGTELNKIYEKWSIEKSIVILQEMDNSLNKVLYWAQLLSGTKNQQISANIDQSQKQTQIVLAWSLFFNALILVLLAIIILPLLRELRRVFVPVRQASESALQGANDALEYTEQVNQSTSQLKFVMNEMGKAIGEVAASAQESSGQAEGIITTVQTTTKFVGELAEKASSINESLNSNQSNLQHQVVQIQELADNIGNSLTKINRNADIAEKLTLQLTALEQELAGVEDFIAALNEITEQTNLLALNASIEAAGAKEFGKGFGIVATRIRRLSEATKELTERIRTTIVSLQVVAKEVGNDLREVIVNMRDTTATSQGVSDEFDILRTVLESLYNDNEKIIKSANHQLDRTNQIYQNSHEIMELIENISAQTQEVSASMEELSAESEEIISQVDVINNNVTETKVLVERQVDLAKVAEESADHF
jgi:methyl-accepting chemotaxis protein